MPQIMHGMYMPVKTATKPSVDPECTAGNDLGPCPDRGRSPLWPLAIVLVIILGLVIAALVIVVRLNGRMQEIERETQLYVAEVNPAVGGLGPVFGVRAVQLVGTKNTQTVSKLDVGQTDPVLQKIGHWEVDQESSWPDQGTGPLRGDMGIGINTTGLYKIYAQLSWRTTKNTLIYEIRKNDGGMDNRPASTLAQCISSFTQNYAQQKSCYTAVTVPLTAGDVVSVWVHRENFTIEFRNGTSFFGIVGPIR